MYKFVAVNFIWIGYHFFRGSNFRYNYSQIDKSAHHLTPEISILSFQQCAKCCYWLCSDFKINNNKWKSIVRKVISAFDGWSNTLWNTLHQVQRVHIMSCCRPVLLQRDFCIHSDKSRNENTRTNGNELKLLFFGNWLREYLTVSAGSIYNIHSDCSSMLQCAFIVLITFQHLHTYNCVHC